MICVAFDALKVSVFPELVRITILLPAVRFCSCVVRDVRLDKLAGKCPPFSEVRFWFAD